MPREKKEKKDVIFRALARNSELSKDFDEFCALLTRMLGPDGKVDIERMLRSNPVAKSGLRLYNPTIMENQMERKMEDDMESGVI